MKASPQQVAHLSAIAQSLLAAKKRREAGEIVEPRHTVEECLVALATTFLMSQPDFWVAIQSLADGDPEALRSLFD